MRACAVDRLRIDVARRWGVALDRRRGRLRDGWVLIESVPVRVPLPGRPGDPFPATSTAGRCLAGVRAEYRTPQWALYPPSD